MVCCGFIFVSWPFRRLTLGYIEHLSGLCSTQVLNVALVVSWLISLVLQNDPQHLSGLVRRVLYQFVGPN